MDSPNVSTILKSVLIGVISRGLAIVSAWLIAKGLVAPELLDSTNVAILATGIAGALITLGWLVFVKIRTWYLVEAARKSQPGTPMSEVKEKARTNSPV